MRGARYVRLIPWTLHSGSKQLLLKNFYKIFNKMKEKVAKSMTIEKCKFRPQRRDLYRKKTFYTVKK